MTDADRERVEAIIGYEDAIGHPVRAGVLRRLLAELDAVTAERDALQAVVVEQAKEE